MRLYTILKLIIQAIKTVKTSLSAKVNDYYYTSASVAATKSATFTVCTLTIPKPGIYLVLGGVSSSVGGGTTTMIAALGYPDTTKAAALIGAQGRSIMSSGGGVHTWGLVNVKVANAKIDLRSYGYYTSAWTAGGSLLAIRLV